MRLTRVLIAAVGLMLIAASASFASVPFVTTSTLNQMAPTAETGLAGNVVLTSLTTGTIPGGEIINISYSPASLSSLSFLKVIMNLGCTPGPCTTYTASGFAAYGTAVGFLPAPITEESPAAGDVTVTATANASYIVITFTGPPADTVNFTEGDNIQISGVRVDVNGPAVVGGPPLTATISSVLGQATVTNPTVQVAEYVNPFTVNVVSGVDFYTNGVPINATAYVTITECLSFTDAFETQCQGAAANAACATALTLSIGNIPSGLAFGSMSVFSTSPGVSAAFPNGNISLTNPGTLYIYSQNPQLIDSIVVSVTFAGTGTTIPLGQGPANVSVTLGPQLTTALPVPLGWGTFGAPVEALGPDLYSYSPYPVPPANITITITPLFTTLLATFNVYNANFAVSPPTGFATGYSILNGSGTILEPTSITGTPRAHDFLQPGTITVYLYPFNQPTANTETYYTFTTAPGITPGSGLNAQGQLPAGGSWTVLLESLLGPAGITSGTFEGTVIFVCNFPDGSGVNFIADPDFAVQAQGYQMIDVFGTGLDRHGECLYSDICINVVE